MVPRISLCIQRNGKKWSQKRYKASPKHKIGTIPFNPKQNGPITEESGKMSEATNQKFPGTQGPFAPKGQNTSISIKASINTTSTQKTTTETISDAAKSPKYREHRDQRVPKVQPTKILKQVLLPPPSKATQEFDDMEGVTSSGSNKHRKAPKGVEYLFITISLLEKLSFAVHLIGGTIKRFRAHVGEQHCFEHYGPQFRMGPTTKITKHMLSRGRDFTMPGVDLLF